MSMDDVLNDTKPAPVSTPEPTQAPEPVAIPEPTQAPEPTPVPVAEPSPPPEPEMTEKERAFLTKANDEKRKRQELEAKLAAIEAERAKPVAQPTPETDQPKDFWEDPEGALKRYEENMSRMVVNTKINTSESIARSKYNDFNEKMAVFHEMVQQSPLIAQQMITNDNPAEFAYHLAKNHQELKQAGSLDGLREQLEKEIRIKLEAEYKAKADEKEKMLSAIPDSLSTVRSTGVNKPVWSGPEPLDAILKSR